MPKERAINPAAAQRKEDKRKAIAKSKKQLQGQRNEKLAKRNPARLQAQIDELKALEGTGSLRPKDKETLIQLEKDLRGVKRAREALGDAAPKFSSGPRQDVGNARAQQKERRAQLQQHLGKRRRNSDHAYDTGSDTDPDVRSIPMPRDTPPPIPPQESLDSRLGPDGVRMPHLLPSKPVLAPAQTVYASAPQLRDLKKESVRFLPSAVQAHKAKIKGQGRLLEPEELDRLEKAGYMKKASDENSTVHETALGNVEQTNNSREQYLDEQTISLQQELAALEQQVDHGGHQHRLHVQMDEVEDDGS